MRAMLDNLGGRRFFATIGCGAVTSLLQWFGKLDPMGSAYTAVTIGTVAAYIVGNTAQKYVDRTHPTEPQP